MRIIGPEVTNEMVISCTISGEDILLKYRTPTSQERQKYFSDLFAREEGQIIDDRNNARLKWGKEILLGIGENMIGYTTGNGIVPVSSDEKSEQYRGDWKDLVEQYSPELIEFLAVRVFEGLRQVPKPKGNYNPKN